MTTILGSEYPKPPEAYHGEPDTRRVIRGRNLDPRPSQKAFNHSPDGFAWGYGGSGPAQLALAILLDMGLDEGDALRLHQEFKNDIIAPLPEHFTLPITKVKLWISRHRLSRGG